MKTLKLFAIAVTLCGFASVAYGNALDLVTFHPANDNIPTITSLFHNNSGFPNAVFQTRLVGAFTDGQMVDNHGFDFFPFLFTFHATNPNSTNANTATVTFNALGSQVGVLGFFVFTGGPLGGELFTVSPDEQLGDTFTITGPPLPFSLFPATISNIDIFIGPPGQRDVPDSGSTAMLLGSALTGLGLLRRYLNRETLNFD